MLLPILFLGVITSAAAQEKTYDIKAVDGRNNNYSLSDCSISGSAVFHCRLQDTVFTLGFDKVRSIAVNAQAASPYAGYVSVNFTLADGRTAQAYVNLDNYWLEGTEVNFNVRIKIKLSDVVRLDLTAQAAPPASSTSPTALPPPSPSPSPAPTMESPAPAPSYPSPTPL